MAIEFYLTHKVTGVTYGPNMGHSHITVDDVMREALGYPPNSEHFLFGWVDTIGYRVAFNQSETVISLDLMRYAEHGSVGDKELLRIWEYLLETYYPSNNWGKESNWRKPTTKKEVNAND